MVGTDKEPRPPAYDARGAPGSSSSGGAAGTSRTAGPTAPSAISVHSSVDLLRTVEKGQQLVCTDEFVNRDAEAMYDFLMAQMKLRPPIICHIVGKHKETTFEERVVENNNFRVNRTPNEPRGDGRAPTDLSAHSRAETTPLRSTVSHHVSNADGQQGHLYRTQTKSLGKHVEEVKAFDFAIELSQYLLQESELWTVGDEEWAYRGGTRKEARLYERAPLRLAGAGQDRGSAHDQSTLKAWIKEYVDRQGMLKGFEWTKKVDGWDFAALGTAIKESILRSGYNGQVFVTFEVFGQRVFVRPPGVWASMNWFGNSLLWISGIKPYLLFYYKEGRWEVAGERWSFRRNGEGLKEGEWFRLWENTIKQAVERKLVSTQALTTPWEQSPGIHLEGYAV